jgi:hypothetical protein
MAKRANHFTRNHLLFRRGWTKELIAAHLGEPDEIRHYPKASANKVDEFFHRSRVEEAEQKPDIRDLIAAREAELHKSRTERAEERLRTIRSAVAAIEIRVELLPDHELKIRALETFYAEWARTGRNAPRTMTADRIADLAFKFAAGRLVDYGQINDAIPVSSPLPKPDLFRICRDQIEAAVRAAYPQLVQSDPEIENAA